jgi:hypothetical protein
VALPFSSIDFTAERSRPSAKLTSPGNSNREEQPSPETRFAPMSQLTLPDDTKLPSLRRPSRASPGTSSTLAYTTAISSRPCPPDPDPDLRSHSRGISAQTVRRFSTVWAGNEPEAFRGHRLATQPLVACLHKHTQPSMRHPCESYIQNGITH